MRIPLPPACSAAILAVYAAQSLLLAFALKLRVAAALAGHRGPRPAAPALAAALGLDDGSLHKAASFLGQCMPTYVQAPGVGRPALKVSRHAAGRQAEWLSSGGGALCVLCAPPAIRLCRRRAAGSTLQGRGVMDGAASK